jgi:ADP-ribose pyrophosphatase
MAYEVRGREVVFKGKILTVRRDMVAMPGGNVAPRDVVAHPGAVGIVALDSRERVLMLRQYRHPIGGYLWELPAGILDVPGEHASGTAARELREEAHLTASRWDVLVDMHTSPGMTDEADRVFLARDLREVPADERLPGRDEEADLSLEWVPLDDAVRRVLDGEITNAMAVIGVLSVVTARRLGYERLRPVDARWPGRPAHSG